MLDLLPARDAAPKTMWPIGEFYALMREKLAEFGATLSGREKEIFDERLMAEDP